MAPDDLMLLVALTALTIYAIFGGADFGAGVWEFSTAFQATPRERAHLYKAIGPVWEANHVWLIFVIVILFNAYPPVFAGLSRALWVPLLLVVMGIVFRGASYAFRGASKDRPVEKSGWEILFAVASTATPFFLGTSLGAIVSGQLAITSRGEFHGDVLRDWLSPFSMFFGFYTVVMCSFLAAVLLYRESVLMGDRELDDLWRRRTLSTGLWMGLLSSVGLIMVWREAPELSTALWRTAWPLIALSIISGASAWIATWMQRATWAVGCAAIAVASVIWGWGVAQYPVLIPPDITSAAVRAPDKVLWMMLAVIGIGATLLLPALAYLFALFKHR